MLMFRFMLEDSAKIELCKNHKDTKHKVTLGYHVFTITTIWGLFWLSLFKLNML